MADQLALALGEPVATRRVSPETYTALGFPGADDLANMFRSSASSSTAIARRAAWTAPVSSIPDCGPSPRGSPRTWRACRSRSARRPRGLGRRGAVIACAALHGSSSLRWAPDARCRRDGGSAPTAAARPRRHRPFTPARPSLRSRRSTRCGRTAPRSDAGSACRRAPPSTRPSPTRGDFPPGTRLWKEFGHARPVETRYLERLADGRGASPLRLERGGPRRAARPEDGPCCARRCRTAATSCPRARTASRATRARPCRCSASRPCSCRPTAIRSRRTPSRAPASRRPRALVAAGRLRNLPPALLARSPRIAGGLGAERAALGYLHANCGHCHGDVGPLARTRSRARATRRRAAGGAARTRASLLDHEPLSSRTERARASRRARRSRPAW